MNSYDNSITKDQPEIHLFGLSHKSATVELREKFSLPEEEVPEFFREARSRGIEEIVYLATCNRMEIYYTAQSRSASVEALTDLLEEVSGVAKKTIAESFYRKHGIDAVNHLVSVAASLDSMVVGENEIFGQLKAAYAMAVDNMATGTVLNKLFHHAFATSKKVKTDTDISRNPLSIAYIAVEQAKKVFDDLSSKRAILIGAGEMGELILKYFTKSEIKDITVVNRSTCNARRIVDDLKSDASILPLEELEDALKNADIVISSVTASDYILTYNTAKSISKKRGGLPLFIIDIAVPRNIDPEIIEINDFFLFNIDDLKRIADDNLRNRLKEVVIAEEIIKESAEEFMAWYDQLEIVPLITSIQDKFNSVREQELDRYRRRRLKHLSDDDYAIVIELTKQIMTKTLHDPIMALKQHRASGGESCHSRESLKQKTEVIREIFNNEDKT